MNKEKKTTCGIIILNEENEILMGKSNGNNFFDIPKGLKDEGESYIDAAIRECHEETNIHFQKDVLKDIGLFEYNKEKNIYLFFIKLNKKNINMEDLKCNSFFEHYYSKKILPEIEYFNWININNIEQHTAKSMSKILNKIIPSLIYENKEEASMIKFKK